MHNYHWCKKPVQKVSSHDLWKVETFIEEDTRNIAHGTMTPQSPSKWAPWDLTQFSQLPSAALSYFPKSYQRSEISSLSKVILILGKARSCRVPNLYCRGLSHLGDLMFCQKTLHETWCVSRCIVMMKLPITICPQLQPSESSESFLPKYVQA